MIPNLTHLISHWSIPLRTQKCICLQVLRSLENLGMAVVEKEWLLDSLGGWEVRPFPAYMVEGIRPAHLLQAGFPAHLTEQA